MRTDVAFKVFEVYQVEINRQEVPEKILSMNKTISRIWNKKEKTI